MSHYVVGDIHGCFDEWIEFKDRIEKIDKEAKFILVGDIIDRGQKTFEMLQWAMRNINDNGKYQMIIGNHEFEKIDWLDKACKKYIKTLENDDISEHIPKQVYDRYGFEKVFIENNRGIKSIIEAIDWFRTLPIYKDIKINNQRFIIVHANLTKRALQFNKDTISNKLSYNTKLRMVWDRDIDGFNLIKDTILVHGHTPTIINDAFPSWQEAVTKGKIVKTYNRYNVDCGIVYKEKREYANLAALRLEDLSEIYLYNSEE